MFLLPSPNHSRISISNHGRRSARYSIPRPQARFCSTECSHQAWPFHGPSCVIGPARRRPRAPPVLFTGAAEIVAQGARGVVPEDAAAAAAHAAAWVAQAEEALAEALAVILADRQHHQYHNATAARDAIVAADAQRRAAADARRRLAEEAAEAAAGEGG